MNLSSIKSKKSLKIVALLVTSLVIATVSAQTYSYMFIHGGATITGGVLSWAPGTGTPGGTTIVGPTVSNLDFSVPADTIQNFTDVLHLINAEASSHTFGLSATVTAGNTAKFTTFDMVVYKSGGARVTSISVKDQGSVSGQTIDASETLYVRFEVQPLAGETDGYLAFTIQLTYE
jgi:hypothetical protein